jgi:hypothetical protein
LNRRDVVIANLASRFYRFARSLPTPIIRPFVLGSMKLANQRVLGSFPEGAGGKNGFIYPLDDRHPVSIKPIDTVSSKTNPRYIPES